MGNPSINELVKDVAQEMQPYFGLSNCKPKVVLDQHAGETPFRYDPEPGIIFARSIQLEEYNRRYTCGEEVCHYLHHQANPAVFARKREFIQLRKQDADHQEDFLKLYNFIEAVGCYGGIVYVSKRFPTPVIEELLSIFCTNIKHIAEGMQRSDAKYEYVKHIYGYKLAVLTYAKQKDAKLTEFARLPAEEGIKLIEQMEQAS